MRNTLPPGATGSGKEVRWWRGGDDHGDAGRHDGGHGGHDECGGEAGGGAAGQADGGDAGHHRCTDGGANSWKVLTTPEATPASAGATLPSAVAEGHHEQHAGAGGSDRDADDSHDRVEPQSCRRQTGRSDQQPGHAQGSQAELGDEAACGVGTGHGGDRHRQEQQPGQDRIVSRRTVRMCCGTGVVGGFTTYSTFVVEVERLATEGHVALGIAYGLGSVALGVAAACGGVLLAGALARRPTVGGDVA